MNRPLGPARQTLDAHDRFPVEVLLLDDFYAQTSWDDDDDHLGVLVPAGPKPRRDGKEAAPPVLAGV